MTRYGDTRRFIVDLHGLRGVSAVWVMLYHTTPGGFGPFQVFGYGYLGVDVFFILSGYVIMHTHADDFRTLQSARIVEFLRLRWWRVYPLYAVSLLLSILACYATKGAWPTYGAMLDSALLLEGWALPGIGLNGPAWSLGVEWLGYFAFPAIAWTLFRVGPGVRAGVAAVLLATVATGIGAAGGGWNPIGPPLSVLRMATEFGAGCILATLGQDWRAWQVRFGDAIVAAGLLGLYAALASGFPAGATSCLAILVFGVAGSGRWTGLLLANRTVLFLGQISFALYITHWIVLSVVKAAFGQPSGALERAGATATFYLIAFPVAAIAYRTIEEPLRRWSRGRRQVLVPG